MGICRIIDARVSDPFAVLKKRQVVRDCEVEQAVGRIIDDVRNRGDAALLDNARKFDAPQLDSIVVTEDETSGACLPAHHQSALEVARERIERFHTLQLAFFTQGLAPEASGFGWQHEGVGQRVKPLGSVGVYVPGGNATYPSSVLMNVIPAAVAGVENRFVSTPARSDGSLAPAVLTALRIAGVKAAFKVGGAAAIAAFALGTESVPRVDKLVGPGNRYVNEAKRQLWGTVGLDGYAGPSEVCVLVDETANAEWAAADLLTQVEHGIDNVGFLISTTKQKTLEILEAMELQLVGAINEQRMRSALQNEGAAILVTDLSHGIELIDAIAPEHLSIMTADPESVFAKVRNASCVFLGQYTPESAGDFVLGPSHTLPTSGAARFASPVNVLDFLKIQSVSQITADQLRQLTPAIQAFGEMEGFPAHAFGATSRKVEVREKA